MCTKSSRSIRDVSPVERGRLRGKDETHAILSVRIGLGRGFDICWRQRLHTCDVVRTFVVEVGIECTISQPLDQFVGPDPASCSFSTCATFLFSQTGPFPQRSDDVVHGVLDDADLVWRR